MSTVQYDPTRMHAKTGSLSGSTTVYNENINFAIIEREQIKLEIYSDLANVITTIKGKEETYAYGARNNEIKNNNYNSITYTGEIYPSDYAYRKELYRGENLQNIEELEVYATYYIKIKNTSKAAVKITELVNYYNPEYSEITTSAYSYGNESGNVTWKANGTYGGATAYGKNKIAYTNYIQGINIEPNGEIYVFIRYKVGKDANRNILMRRKTNSK